MGFDKTKPADMERVYSIIKECSADSLHYLTFNEENMYFFGVETYGMISYTLAGKKAMSLGDPVCKSEDMEQFTCEYLDFCKKMKYKPIFNSVSYQMTEILKKYNYTVIKYGEEAILELTDYTLAGKYRAALRRNVSKVGKSGVTLLEYQPNNGRDYVLEEKIADLAEKWLTKKKYQLDYTVGNLNFEKFYDRRFFVTMDENGNLLTALSFLPYEGGKNYCIDVMYRKLDAMTGIMEHAIISAAMKMKEEGTEKVSLGIAPLAGIDVNKQDVSKTEKLLNAVFNYMDSGYNYKNLYRFKKKFDPTIWEPRYLVYHHDISLVSLAVSIGNTKGGSSDFILYMKYKFFLIGFTLGLYKVENENA